MPTITANTNPPAVSWSVTGTRSITASNAGRPLTMDCPQSPVSALPSQMRYWSGSGLSKPISLPHASQRSGSKCEYSVR